MRTSASRSRSEARPDEQAVSEIVGYLLIFLILSIVLVMSMLAFNELHQRAQSSVAELRAQSVAQRVSASVVDAALFAESHGSDIDTSTYQHPLDLPRDIEGHSYRVYLDAAPEQVRVLVLDLGVTATAPLFSAGASSSFDVCASNVLGGSVRVRFDRDPTDLVAPYNHCVFVELNQ